MSQSVAWDFKDVHPAQDISSQINQQPELGFHTTLHWSRVRQIFDCGGDLRMFSKSRAVIHGALFAMSLSFLGSQQADAAIYLDQLNNALTPLNQFSPQGANSGSYFGQSFTVGRAGTLSNIRVPVFNFGAPAYELTFYLVPISLSDFPLQSNARTVSFNSADIPSLGVGQDISDINGWLNIDYSSFNISVQPGDQFGLVFNGPTPFVDPGPDGTVAWLLSLNNFGAEHMLNFSSGIRDYSNQGGFFPYDSAGIATYVSGVPEPDTWIMMILGFGIAGLALRKRTRPNLALG